MIRLRYIPIKRNLSNERDNSRFWHDDWPRHSPGRFFWQYIEGKERRATILEISKTIDDPDRLDEKKANQQTIDVVGLSLFLLASVSMRLEHSQWEDFSRESALSLIHI